MNIELIIAAAFFLAAFLTIAVDRYQSRKHRYTTYLVVLRLNNEYVRNILQQSGIPLCWCAKLEDRNPYLFTTEGDKVCGFCEERNFLIASARINHQTVIDCGINTKLFISEVKKLQKLYSV